jgi:predicted secreted protein
MAITAFGTLFKKGATAVFEVTNVSGPNTTRDTIDTTHMETATGWKTYLAGLKDGGDVSLDIQYTPSNSTHKAALADLVDGSADTYNLVFSDASTVSFDAYVTAFSPTAPVDGKLTASLTFKVTGPITFPA